MTRATILIVEDEAIVAADLAGKLGQLGYHVAGMASTGEEAIGLARVRRPDLILMDIRLAGETDGVEAAETIRRELGLPVIFLTAHSDSATLERAKLTEPFGYILKPFEERELATTIEMALYKHQAECKLRQAHDALEARVEERTKELKEAEKVLREVNETLEQRVAERTAELATANTLLRGSRLAALNMMEDAVAARKIAEEATSGLEREIAKRIRIQEALEVSYTRLNLIAETAELLLKTDSPQKVVNELCRKVMTFLDCHAFFNFLVDEEAGRLHLNACAGIPDEDMKAIEWLDYGVAVCGCAAREACRIVAEDIPATPDPRTDLVKSYGILAYACHPLMAHGKVLGTLSFGTRTRSRFNDEELSLMKAVADQVAIAMERKHAEEDLRRAHDELELRVSERTEELDATIARLKSEIAEREKAEAKILRLNRLYAVLSETNQAIVRAADQETLFQEFCRIAVDHGGFLLAWVGLVDEPTGIIRRIAAAGATGYLENLQISRNAEPAGLGPTGTAVREGTLCICNDFLGSGITSLWHEKGRAYNIAASASVPFKEGDQVVGAITLYADTRDFFDEQQAGLISQLGADMSYARDNLAREAQRRETEEALLQAQKMETVGRLAGGIAHDFNNLLTVMSGFAEQALEANDIVSARPALDHIIAAGARAKELTHKLLTFSRQQVMQKCTINLGQVVDDMLRLLKRLIGENIEVSVSLPDFPVAVDADTVQIEQVLTNIVVNARDAMPEGGSIQLSVGRTTLEEPKTAGMGLTPGDYAFIEVSDTGIGIPPADVERIFDPFFSTKEMGKGTGLGLSIAYGIVRQHCGAIAVETSIGRGSIFTVYLPLVSNTFVSAAPVLPAPLPGGGEQTLLLVEDDPVVRLLLKLMLQKAGYTVIEAENGEAALKASEANHFDLLVSDVLMPNMNGMNLYGELKKRKPELQAILISGYSSDILQTHLPDGVKFLQKPVSKALLLESVGEILRQDSCTAAIDHQQ